MSPRAIAAVERCGQQRPISPRSIEPARVILRRGGCRARAAQTSSSTPAAVTSSHGLSRQLSAVLRSRATHFGRRPGSWPVHAKLRPGLRVRLLDRLNAGEQGRSGRWQSTLREPGFVNGLRLAHVGLPRRRYAHFDRRRCSQQTTNRDPSDPPVARSLPTPLWRRTSCVTITVAHCRRSAFRPVMSRLPSFTPGSHRGRDFRCSCRHEAEKSCEFPSNGSRNRLLAVLSHADRDLLTPTLETIALDARQILEAPSDPIRHVYFVESGLVSVVGTTQPDHRIEVGMVGYEGMTGLSIVLGDDRSANETWCNPPARRCGLHEVVARDAGRQPKPHRHACCATSTCSWCRAARRRSPTGAAGSISGSPAGC